MKADKGWSYQGVNDLITEYEKCPLLYNTTVNEYKNRTEKKAALQHIEAVSKVLSIKRRSFGFADGGGVKWLLQ